MNKVDIDGIIKLENVLKDKDKEIERLNNIINELEEHLINQINDDRSVENHWLMGVYDEDKEILNKLRELKEGK